MGEVVHTAFELQLFVLPVVVFQEGFEAHRIRGFNLSLAFFAARIGSVVTDFKNIVPFIARVWLFLSGVFFSVADVSKNLPDFAKFLMEVNPGYVFIELHRTLLMPNYPIDPKLWLLGLFWAVVPIVFAYPFFWAGEQTYGKS